MLKPNIVLYQFNTIQSNIIQYNTIKYNTIQYNTILCTKYGPREKVIQMNFMNTIPLNMIQCGVPNMAQEIDN